ncbi:acyl transferase/acyl hydrolase/lysophospholipase [Rhexocercosporidium sp. MPI-PUGE-AT-0058]|nr:acyl transferase/acyl hydrolase/lysophospholipase [Rhexocercosporidium sp. MPI-PUGE-AT-0058]
MSNPNPARGQDLRLLCLDGGGVRGLSSLHIVKRLMESINLEEPPKPCDHFDMIGGISTGGLIALMLGRLAMPIDEAIEAYIALSPKIFTKMHHRVTLKGQVQGRFDHTAIEEGVGELLDEKGYDRDELLKDCSELGCKTFVCATSKLAAETVVLSTYPSRRRGSDLLNIAKVWEVARATSAASSFFDPVIIGNFDFIDGSTPANNPISEMWTEAFDVFKKGDNWRLEDNILCLVSIGTGIPAIRSFGDDTLRLGKALPAIATDTERRAEDFHRHHSHMAQNRQYFRFNVLWGLESVGLDETSKLDQISACTQKYLQSETVCSAVEACGKRLIARENLQPVIEAAKYIGHQALTASGHILESENMNSALNCDSDSLSWFTNTSGTKNG